MNKKIMTDKEIKDCLEILRRIYIHCNYEKCEDCHFASDKLCMFFNRPWEWELEKLEERV